MRGYTIIRGLTQGKDEGRLIIEACIILSDFFKCSGDGVSIEAKSRFIALLLPCSLKSFECRESSPKCWLFLSGEVLLHFVRILCRMLVTHAFEYPWATDLKNSPGIENPRPVRLGELKCCPWNMFDSSTMMANGGNGSELFVCC
jgi:hypothetical protein